MDIFKRVKENVTARMAAERYGLRPNAHGMCLCPFHKERTPSFWAATGYYCHGCLQKGDVIDLTAALFHLTPLQAARKLAADFGVTPADGPLKPAPTVITEAMRERQRRQEEEKWLAYAQGVITRWERTLRRWKEAYAPKEREDPWDERFVTACRQLDRIERLADTVIYGDDIERAAFARNCKEEVEDIAKRLAAAESAGDQGGCGAA